jgi:hypothetical protein
MSATSCGDSVLGGAYIRDIPAISANGVSYAVSISSGVKRPSVSAATPRRLRCSHSSWLRSFAATGGRLHDALAVSRRIADRRKKQ